MIGFSQIDDRIAPTRDPYVLIVWGRGPVVVHRAGGGGSNLPRLCLKRL